LTTEDYARQTARARADANIANFQSQTQGQKHEVERQATEQAALTQSLSDTASAWEREWQASDPDYPKKVSLVRRDVELAFRRDEVERTPEAVRVMLDKVRKQVETEMRAFLPKQKAVNPNLPSDGSGGTSAPKKPETLMDAIDMALLKG
jgi:molecular chaperone GrpE (heat shock protein)